MSEARACLLAIEISHDKPSLAIAKGGEIVARPLGEGRKYVEHIPAVLDALLQEAGVAKADIEGVAVSRGPGGFSGVRVGLSFARGLALALSVPCYGVSSLVVLAEAVGSSSHAILAAINALRGELYVQCFSADRKPLGEAEAVSPAVLAERIKEKEIICVGSGAGIAKERFASAQLVELEELLSFYLIEYVWRVLAAGEAEVLSEWQPIYLRAPDAKPADPANIVKRK